MALTDKTTKPAVANDNAVLNTKSGQKNAKLNNKGGKQPASATRQIPKQLIYPYDLANVGPQMDHPGHAVVFILNQTQLSAGIKNEYAARTTGVNKVKIDGFAGKEVVMQSGAGAGDNRHEVKGKGRYVRTDLSIVLPPPDQWQENFVINWHSADLGSIRRAGDMMDSVVKQYQEGKWSGEAVDQAMAASKNTISALVQSVGGPALGDFLAIESGMVENNYDDMVFKNVNARSFPFQYNFTPRNEAEAQTVHDIINRLKWAAAPEYWKGNSSNTAYLAAPYTFDIFWVDLKTGQNNKYWHKMATCALTNLSVNRTPNGEYAVLSGGQQASITLEMQFVELFSMTKSSFSDPDNSF